MARSAYALESPRGDWREYAACGPDTANLFLVGSGPLGAGARQALAMCAACRAQPKCDQWGSSLPGVHREGQIIGGRIYGRNGKPRPMSGDEVRAAGTHRWILPVQRACDYCGTDYEAWASGSRYCGSVCINAARREKVRERRAAAKEVPA